MLKRVGAILLALALATVAFEAAHLLEKRTFDIPLFLYAWIALPIVAFTLAYRRSPAFRAFVLSIDLRVVVTVQAIRLAGALGFFVLYADDKLPAAPALVPGIADLVIAYTAIVIGFWWLSHSSFSKRGFVAWNLFGIGDFVATAAVYTLWRYNVLYASTPDFMGTEVLSRLPMGLLPAFMVPVMTLVHVVAILQVRGDRQPRIRPLLVSSDHATAEAGPVKAPPSNGSPTAVQPVTH